MLKIYTVSQQFKIDDKDWQECGERGWVCREESSVAPETIRANCVDWHEMARLIETSPYGWFDGLVTDKTFFRKCPYIRAFRCGWHDEAWRFFPKDFKTISYRVLYEERSYISMEWIFEHLSADKAIQYFKERGMNVCPIATH